MTYFSLHAFMHNAYNWIDFHLAIKPTHYTAWLNYSYLRISGEKGGGGGRGWRKMHVIELITKILCDKIKAYQVNLNKAKDH